jgi:hypothetical protein
VPPRQYSRHTFTSAVLDDEERLYLTTREPYRYLAFQDNLQHVVRQGESLETIANRYYQGFTDNPSRLWWVLADFQPEPIIDPTLELEPGSIIVVPSVRTLVEEVFSELRREDRA